VQNSFTAKVFISAGSNSGDRLNYLRESLHQLEGEALSISEISSVYETEPWEFEDPVPFLNLCFSCFTSWNPPALMKHLLDVEQVLGRVRHKEAGYCSRTLDLDILFWDDLHIYSPDLQIPHPRAHLRRFVLAPMAELAPDYIHPEFGKTMAALLAECPDHGEIRRMSSLF
jgi:2-amino-4-hydroxy-6-hydroxymethyldihydropteridine diphosphokinase